MPKEINIRVWQVHDMELITKHLLVAGDPTGDCANCKEIGIDIATSKNCPKCKTEFKYIATRLDNNPTQAGRLKKKRPDLIAIDLGDYKEALAREKAHNIF